MEYSLHPLGDNAVIIQLGKEINIQTQQRVQVIASYFDENHLEWMVEYIPAFTTITIIYDPVSPSLLGEKFALPYEKVCYHLDTLLPTISEGQSVESRVVEVPVCYGGEFGPDLDYVAKINNLTKDEVIHIHSTGDYIVYMIGFAPGFPYIGGMSEMIAAPRRETPRLKISARTVGIAGMQTGVYPIETPGGWQLIGRTPIELFRPDENPPSLLRAGDKIRFKPISEKEYREWEEDKRC
ncbi:5-oxoprolinase subunit PxpB [Peribacillus saganii]|uniref:5-oxoprolinase subunit PxpB n=1 Tax=Peribacillus saganii TaxID=2303992 RepID=A0A372LTL0_9BACI|nr:5-oxoprolinase subunit PxpB [Peribacillus saganii]RFU71396.1 5-oxoprolinase subunit PxpB [Peribacillus saganii]